MIYHNVCVYIYICIYIYTYISVSIWYLLQGKYPTACYIVAPAPTDATWDPHRSGFHGKLLRPSHPSALTALSHSVRLTGSDRYLRIQTLRDPPSCSFNKIHMIFTCLLFLAMASPNMILISIINKDENPTGVRSSLPYFSRETWCPC